MSLTLELKDRRSPVKQFFATRLPRSSDFVRGVNLQIQNADNILPTGPVRYDLVAMALDYRLRLYLDSCDPTALVAWKGALLARRQQRVGGNLLIRYFGEFQDALDKLKPSHKYLDKRQERLLLRHCYVMACFEELFRAGTNINSPLYRLRKDASIREMLDLITTSELNDLIKLSYLLYSRWKSQFKLAMHLNPTFDGSACVGGADADLIVANCLWEIKTTVTPTIQGIWLHQLIGYWLLDFSNHYKIRELGIYMARQGLFLKWPVRTLLRQMSPESKNRHSLDSWRNSFRKVCKTLSPFSIWL
jgi:hypothetical protein